MNVNGVKNGAAVDPRAMMEGMQKLAEGAEKAEGGAMLGRIVGEQLMSQGVRMIFTCVRANAAADPKAAGENPELEEPTLNAACEEVDLAKVVALLKMATDEIQAREARKRIEAQKSEIKDRTTERMNKINESLKKMDDAAKASKFMKIFGWIAVAIAIVVAAVASFVTGGIAIGPAVGAAVALGFQIANATGAMEKLTEKLSDLFEKWGMSKEAAQVMAAVTIAVLQIAISVGAGVGADKVATLSSKFTTMRQFFDAFGKAGEVVKQAANMVKWGMAATGTIGGTHAAVTGYESGIAQSELTKFEALLKMLRKKLEDSQDELAEILQQLMNGPAAVAKLLESATDAESLIAKNIGQMA